MATASWKELFHVGRRFLAKNWLKFHPQLTIIGVTGSYGKTSTTRAIATVLAQRSPTLQTDLNLDTVYNLPITLLKLRSQHNFLVLEMGVDHKGEMDSHLSLVKPSIGVVTGVTPVHAEPELLGSLEGIVEEKSKLPEALPKNGWAILNRDNRYVWEMAKNTQAKVLGYGLASGADFWADQIKVSLTGTSFDLHYSDPQSGRKALLAGVKMGLLGEHFVHAALAATAVGLICGLSKEQIITGLVKLKPLPGRMSLEKGPLGITVLDDHLRANPASTLAGLKTLKTLVHRGRKIAILGEMGELGRYTQEEHRRIGKEVAGLKIDFLLGVGPLQKLTIEEAVKNGFAEDQVFWAQNVREAAIFFKSYLKDGDLVYLKGSLLKHLERIIILLEGRKVTCDLVSCHYYQPCQTCPRVTDVG